MWPAEKEMRAFYGDPDPDRDGVANRKWEDENLVLLAPAYPMVLAWDPKAKVKAIRVNKRCAESLGRVLARIGAHGPEFISKHGLHLYGGCYNFRAKRGSSVLSTHSYGAAIDLSPTLNSWKRKYQGGLMMPMEVVAAFAEEGWRWGGKWPVPDAMHFQATA